MLSWHKIKTRLTILRRIPYTYYFIASVLLVATLYIMVFREKTLVYSYGGENCDQRLVLLPGMFRQAGSEKFAVAASGGWNVAGYQVTATSLCMSPTEAPTENSSDTVAFAPFGGWLGRFTYSIESREYPSVDTNVLKTPIPVTRELELPLSEPDQTFSYRISIEDKKAQCIPDESRLRCDVPDLHLKQGSNYALTLEKFFKDKRVDEVAKATIETLSPLSVTTASIEKDATVYDKPKSVTITVDKSLAAAEFTAWRTDGDSPTEIAATSEFSGNEVKVTFAEDLPRQAVIELKPVKFEADDGSTTLDLYSLIFKTSGGPKVVAVNVGTAGVGVGAQIIVTFDQELSAEQDIGPLIATGGGVAYQARQGNRLFFSTGGAGRCQNISITLKAGIKSPYDTSGLSAWQYNGRTLCYVVTTIGTSSQGRAINAYHFGTSGPAIIYTGAIHGNEHSTKSLMDRWIGELDANPSQIPAGKRVIVVPSINPDGVARGSRVNSRNVDLNRNFATGDWKKDIEHTNGSAFPGGGGESPMSEPETKAIANFVAAQSPELVISYHSIGGLVISNQRGQANGRASQYASLSGYRLSSGGGGEFGYSITGTADDYYGEKLGVPSILIELGSHSYHQFERNRAAMWAVMR